MNSNKKEVESKKIVKLLSFSVLFFFIILFSVSGINILNYIKDSKENRKVFEEMAQDIVIQEVTNDSSKDNSKYKIDFESLKQKNSDTVGFLKVEGTDIEHVVVKAKDNNYYLSHNFEKSPNSAGWIFIDYRNNLDGTDNNIIIYGHNMKNGTMFASLENVLNSEWKEKGQNRYITFITENETAIYEVFSVYEIENEDYYIKTNFKGNEFNNFINIIKKRSKYDFDTDVSENNKILTLSTCGNNNKYRIVLHAKKVLE